MRQMSGYDDLRDLLQPGMVRLNEPLSLHSTFRIGGLCDALCLPERMEELAGILQWVTDRGVEWLVIGNGSNLLFPDEGFPGVVIKIRGTTAAPGTLWELSQDGEYVRAGAGVSLAKLAWFTAGVGLGGVAFGTGIPGVVGGAIRGNAGAHGCQIGDSVVSVDVVSVPDKVATLSAEQVAFGYRSAGLDASLVITAAVFKLKPEHPDRIRDQIRDYTEYRKRTQPSAEQSAGCLFKNPEGRSAGQLIDSVGLKGFRLGGASVSDRHANFIVNRGDATAKDVRRLAETIRHRVFLETGVTLEMEVNVVRVQAVAE